MYLPSPPPSDPPEPLPSFPTPSRSCLRAAGLGCLLLTSPVWCCVLYPVIDIVLRPFVYFHHGRWPAGSEVRQRVEKGMSPDEVIAAVGRPHKRESVGNQWQGWGSKQGPGDNRERWHYFRDSLGTFITTVSFDEHGRVDGVDDS